MAVNKPMPGRQPGGVPRKPCQRRPAACAGRYNTSRLMNLALFHISNLDFFHRSEPRPRGD
jgi:hypothetical protein